MKAPTLALILVGAGSSRRMSGIDKVWAPLAGEPIVWHSVTRFAPLASATILVVRGDALERARGLASELPNVKVVAGGDERRHSVALGLQALPPVDIVAVHDIARPLAPVSLFARGLAALSSAYSGAVPVVQIPDTLKRVDASGVVIETVERATLRAVQTPQFFRFETLRRLHTLPSPPNVTVTDDAQLLELAGHPIVTFEGDDRAFKITTRLDLTLARLLTGEEITDRGYS